MEDQLYFSNFVTKSLQPINSDDRYFEGYLTVQVKDKQGEITIVDELYKVLPVWMDRGAPISDTHSNRIVGKGINYSKTSFVDKDGSEYPAIKITGKIHKNYELDHEIWTKIKSGEYKGLSFGGATRTNREPIVMKDGSIAYALKELEHYEVAVCRDPAVPLAIITDHNSVAKAIADHTEDRGDGKMVIKCSKFGCYVEKKAGEEDKLVTPEEENEMYNQLKEYDKKRQTYDMYKAEYTEKTIEDVAKADLGKYSTFQGKVQALMGEGYAEENAKKIVGAFVKGEKKKDGDGGSMSTSTDGAFNARYNEEGEEDKKKTYTGGTRHASKENQQGPGNSAQVTISRDVATGVDEEDNVSEKREENTGAETMHNLYNQNEPQKPGVDDKIKNKTKGIILQSSLLINRLRDL